VLAVHPNEHNRVPTTTTPVRLGAPNPVLKLASRNLIASEAHTAVLSVAQVLALTVDDWWFVVSTTAITSSTIRQCDITNMPCNAIDMDA